MKISKSYIPVMVLSVLALLLAAAGCDGIASPGGPPQSAVEGVTDSEGTADIKVKGQSISVIAVDKTYPDRSLSDVEVSVGEQQGVRMVYSLDKTGKYLPEIKFLSPDKEDARVVTVPLSPAGDSNWSIDQPVKIPIDPTAILEAASMPYAELGGFLRDEYPQVNTVIFLFPEEVGDIGHSNISVHESPFPEVLYAHVKEGGVAGFRLVPRVNALFALTLGFVVKTAATAVLGSLLIDEKDVLIAVSERLTGRSSQFIYVPDLYGMNEEEAREALDANGFTGVPLDKHSWFLTDSKYITEHAARNLDGLIVDQSPEPNESYDPIEHPEEIDNLSIKIWVGTSSLGPEPPENDITGATVRINTKAEWADKSETATIRFYISTSPQVSGTAQYDDRGREAFVGNPGGPQTYGDLTDPGMLLQEVTVSGGAGVPVQELTFDVTEYFQENGLTTYYVAADNQGPAMAVFYCLIFYDVRHQKGLNYPYGDSGDHQAGLFGPPHPLVIKWGRNPGNAVEIRMDPP